MKHLWQFIFFYYRWIDVSLAITIFFSSLKYNGLLQPHTKIKISACCELPQWELGEIGLHRVHVTSVRFWALLKQCETRENSHAIVIIYNNEKYACHAILSKPEMNGREVWFNESLTLLVINKQLFTKRNLCSVGGRGGEISIHDANHVGKANEQWTTMETVTVKRLSSFALAIYMQGDVGGRHSIYIGNLDYASI